MFGAKHEPPKPPKHEPPKPPKHEPLLILLIGVAIAAGMTVAYFVVMAWFRSGQPT